MRYLVLGIVIAIAGCTSTGSTGVVAQSCPPNSQLTYANFGQLFIGENCLQCHTTDAKPPLTTPASIQYYSDMIAAAAVYTDTMPKGTTMDVSQRELLAEWLACGAP